MAKKNFKQLAIDHVEKVVFGLFVLIVLMALAGTRWSPYSGTPNEITEKVAKGRQVWKMNVWPEEERAQFVPTKEAAPANIVYERLYKEFSPAPIEMSSKMVVDIRGGTDPLREPELLTLQNPIVSGGRVFLEVIGDELPVDPATPAPTTPMPDDNVPDEFRKRQNNVAGMEGGMASLEYTSMEMSSMMDPMSGMMEATGPTLNLNGQGYHFASIRAVFPVRDQILKYADAIHKTYHYAAGIFDIIDFELERQTAQSEGDPWSGPWQKVDIQTAEDIIGKSASLDAEVVNSVITNSVITMPLPGRITGEWRRQATHPQIERYELSDSQIAMETEMQRKLLQEAAAQKKQMDASVVKRGGFAKTVFDPRQLEVDMFGGGNMYSAMPSFESAERSGGMGGGMGAGTRNPRAGAQVNPLDKLVADMARGAVNRTEEEKRIRDWIKSRVTAEGELLLFRYFDFNVEPGKTYRYRVRLVLTNPNFGRHIAEAGGVPHVIEGETRTTPWSPITEPVTIEEDIKYFVTNVSEQATRVLPTARFDVYEWNPTHGTFINSAFDIRMGQPIADEVETVVIDPAKGSNESKKYRFSTQDFLVDTFSDIRLEDSLHEKAPDGKTVKIPVTGVRGKVPLPPQTLVAKSTHDLVYLSPTIDKTDHQRLKTYMDYQNKQFEYLKAPKVDESLEALQGLGLAEGAMMEGEGQMTRKQKSALKRQLKKAAGSGSMPGSP